MAQVITIAGESLFAIKAQNNEQLDIDTFIFANVPGQVYTAEIDRNESLPPLSQRVHTQTVQQTGKINDNVVVYSTVLDSLTGPFDFNWVGLYSSVNETLIAISHVPKVSKTVTVAGEAGNTLNRNFGIQFTGIANLTGISVEPETWQIDFSSRLNGIQDLTRKLAVDLNGENWFIDDGFKVVPGETVNSFKVTTGVGYVSGLRIEIDTEYLFSVNSYETFVYVDAWFDGTSETAWEGYTQFTISKSQINNYVDSNGKQHYVCKLAILKSANVVEDLRKLEQDNAGKNTFGTVAEMVSGNALLGTTVNTIGYYALGDGGHNEYLIVESNTGIADGGAYINLNNGLQAKGLFKDEVNVEQFAVNGADDTSAFANAIKYCAANDRAQLIAERGPYKVTKILLNTEVSLLGNHNGRIDWLPVTLSNLHAEGTVDVIKDGKIILGTSTNFNSSMIGRGFKLDNSDTIYTVTAVISSTEINVRPLIQIPTGTGLKYKIYDHFGMLEIPAGVVNNCNLKHIKFNGDSLNPEGWFAYLRANGTGGPNGTGGYWQSEWDQIEALNFYSLCWWRGTAGDTTIANGTYNYSLEPHQFINFNRVTLTKKSGSGGDQFRMTGQVNQFNGLGGRIGGGGSIKGLGVYMDREPLAYDQEPTLYSAKVPQGFDIKGMTLQFCEKGLHLLGGNGINIRQWYFEEVDKLVYAKGIANSNRVVAHIDNPQIRGGCGGNGGWIVKAEQDSAVSVNDPDHISNNPTLPAYIDNGSLGLVFTGSWTIQGVVTGIPNNWFSGCSPTLAVISKTLNCKQHGLVVLSDYTVIDTIQSDCPPGKVITILVESPNGVVFTDKNNIRLPHSNSGNHGMRITRDTYVRLIRTDTLFYLEEVYSPKNIVPRGSSFTLDMAYRNTKIYITATTVITIPDDTSTPYFVLGDEIDFYLTASSMTFEAAAGVTIFHNSLTTDFIGAKASVTKIAANTWFINISI